MLNLPFKVMGLGAKRAELYVSRTEIYYQIKCLRMRDHTNTKFSEPNH